MGRERRKNGKYNYSNMRVVFELMHATKVSCNVVFIGNTNILISIPSHCAARWEVSPKCAQPQSTQSTIMLYTELRTVCTIRLQSTLNREFEQIIPL